jgi:phosphoglycerate dehydrogenase-like enzyme
VDTQALVEATGSGRITAALDVTDPEPLPADHPLWHTPGVLVSPHVGGVTTAFTPRAVALLRDQIAAFVGGRRLRNVVNADETTAAER